MPDGFRFETGKPEPYIRKDPDAVLDYKLNWAKWLNATPSGEQDTIQGQPVWTVPAPLILNNDDNDETSATVWLQGGVAGQVYRVSCRILTSLGRTDERTFRVICVQR